MDNDPEKWSFLPALTDAYETKTPEAQLNDKVPKMPWLKYFNVLDNLHGLMDEIRDFGGPKPGTLETVMIDWLRDVKPDKVIPRHLRAIHEFACAIGDIVGHLDDVTGKK